MYTNIFRTVCQCLCMSVSVCVYEDMRGMCAEEETKHIPHICMDTATGELCTYTRAYEHF